MAENKYLPLGSIVLLSGGTQKLLIIARAINATDSMNNQFFFDYGGVAYPEGLTGDQMAYFNCDAVETVIFEGYHDIEDEHMIRNINSYLNRNSDIKRGSPEAWNI